MNILLNDLETNKKIADSLHELGKSYEKINLENAIFYYKQAYALRTRMFENVNQTSILESLESIACCYEKMRNFEKALVFKKKAFQIKRFEHDMSYFNFEKILDEKICEKKKIQNKENADESENLVYISNILHEKGVSCEKKMELVKSLQFFKRSLEIRESISIKSNIHKLKIAESYFSVGTTLIKLGNLKFVH